MLLCITGCSVLKTTGVTKPYLTWRTIAFMFLEYSITITDNLSRWQHKGIMQYYCNPSSAPLVVFAWVTHRPCLDYNEQADKWHSTLKKASPQTDSSPDLHIHNQVES